MKSWRMFWAIVFVCGLIGCGARTGQWASKEIPSPQATVAATATTTLTPFPPSPTAEPTTTPSATASATPTATVTPTITPSPTATPDPYAGLVIEDLTARTRLEPGSPGAYGQGELAIVETINATNAFTRTLISYPSDDLTIYGFMNTPFGAGPFPVAIVLHGYIEPAKYDTLAYTTRYADSLARAGYVVLHPNLRGYPPSDSGPNTFQVGMAVDTLNLIALVQKQAGRDGPLAQADGDHIGLMGHSMGGGITIRVLTVSPAVRAGVLYAAMNADEKINYEQRLIWRRGREGTIEPLDVPERDLQRISPVFYLDRITAPISIHHSRDDATVPFAWSEDLAARLEALDKEVEFYEYANTPHTFQGASDQQFIKRMIAFFDQHLKQQQ